MTTGTTLSLSGTATDPSTAVAAAGYAETWSVSNNGVAVASGTGPSIAFTPTSQGTYTATFTAVDKDGLSGTSTVTIPVLSPSHLPFIQTPNDTIPNFVASPTIVSVASGNWSESGDLVARSGSDQWRRRGDRQRDERHLRPGEYCAVAGRRRRSAGHPPVRDQTSPR